MSLNANYGHWTDFFMQYTELSLNSMFNRGLTCTFWPRGLGVMTIFKKLLSHCEICFVEVDVKDTYKQANTIPI